MEGWHEPCWWPTPGGPSIILPPTHIRLTIMPTKIKTHLRQIFSQLSRSPLPPETIYCSVYVVLEWRNPVGPIFAVRVPFAPVRWLPSPRLFFSSFAFHGGPSSSAFFFFFFTSRQIFNLDSRPKSVIPSFYLLLFFSLFLFVNDLNGFTMIVTATSKKTFAILI